MSEIGLSALRGQTGESIRITFEASFVPGEEGWDIKAQRFGYTLTVADEGPLPDAYHVILDADGGGSLTLSRSGNVYAGEFAGSIYIRSGYSGNIYDKQQFHRFFPVIGNEQAEPLLDPINGTSWFQTDMFYATTFSITGSEAWPQG